MNPDSTELPPLENILVAALYLATNFAKSGSSVESGFICCSSDVEVDFS